MALLDYTYLYNKLLLSKLFMEEGREILLTSTGHQDKSCQLSTYRWAGTVEGGRNFSPVLRKKKKVPFMLVQRDRWRYCCPVKRKYQNKEKHSCFLGKTKGETTKGKQNLE